MRTDASRKGGVFLLYAFCIILVYAGKIIILENCLGKSRKERNMSRKRKHPVRKMTEKDYENYLMSLKDEKPAKAVVPRDPERNGDE